MLGLTSMGWNYDIPISATSKPKISMAKKPKKLSKNHWS
jgi:hypothetical protein